MNEARALKRHHLIYYLEVYNQDDGELVGHLVDINTRGIKLVSRQPVPILRTYHLRMMLPEELYKEREITFSARSLWSSNDVNRDYYDTGFETSLDSLAQEIINDLIKRLGFNN
jgi:hypothetical protein